MFIRFITVGAHAHNNSSIPQINPDHDGCQACFVNFIVQDMRPIGVMEGQGFQNLLKILEPGYSVPARQTIMHALTAKYGSLKETVSESANNKALSLTTDNMDVSSNGVPYDSDFPFH